MVSPVLQLKCYCNNYPTGDYGSKSIAARLCAKTPGTDFKIDENKPYAEMWMGTYPKLPSYVLETGEDLQDVLDKNKELIGDKVIKKFGHSKIPYLPKVLSIAKALSLQIHPDKDLAAKLHEQNPDQFQDTNHKPEIALALTRFEAFVGWKPLKDIKETFDTLPPIKKYLDTTTKSSDFTNDTLKKAVVAMLKDSEEGTKKVQEELGAIPKEKYGSQSHILELLPRLQDQHGKTDPGSLVALLTMNYLDLPPHSSIYIPADAPHAYIKGDIIECMARSDNVLNTGFCPRPDRDSIDVFAEGLTFEPHSAEEAMLHPRSFDRASGNGKTQEYAPPLSEFSVLRTSLGAGEKETIAKLGGPSQFICTSGSGTLKAAGQEYKVSEGYIFFVGQGQEMQFASDNGLDIYTAFVE